MTCDCFDQLNEQFANHGYELESRRAINTETGKVRTLGPILAIKWKGKKPRGRRLPFVMCAYCPMCGKKFDEGETPSKKKTAKKRVRRVKK